MENTQDGKVAKNIVLTGQPRAGKTTLLEKLVEDEDGRRGFVTREIRENGERTGFLVVTHSGEKRLLASKYISGDCTVKDYKVDVGGFGRVIKPLTKGITGKLLYIDEIGQMELYSHVFQRMVKEYIRSDSPFIGTMSEVYEHSIIDWVRNRQDVEIIKVDKNNRDHLYNQLAKVIK